MSILKKGKMTVLLALLALSLTTTAYATKTSTSATTITFMKSSKKAQASTPKEVNRKVCVNGTYLSGIKVLDQNGTTLLPLRSVAEALNCEVNYDSTNKVAIVLSGDSTIELPLGYTFGVINGNKTAIPNNVSSVVYNSSTYLPVRFVSESLSCSIDYDPSTQTVFITTDGQSPTAQTAPSQQVEPQPEPTPAQPEPTSAPTQQVSTGVSPQQCVDEKIAFSQIDPSYLTKRLTADQWLKLCPHLKGYDLSYLAEHGTPIVVHVPLISTYYTSVGDSKISAMWKSKSDDDTATLLPGNLNHGAGSSYIYFKDGTYAKPSEFPKDKDLDDVSYIVVEDNQKKTRDPMTIFIYIDKINKDLPYGTDGVQKAILADGSI